MHGPGFAKPKEAPSDESLSDELLQGIVLEVAAHDSRRIPGNRVPGGNAHVRRARRLAACDGGNSRREIFCARTDRSGRGHGRVVYGWRLDDAGPRITGADRGPQSALVGCETPDLVRSAGHGFAASTSPA